MLLTAGATLLSAAMPSLPGATLVATAIMLVALLWGGMTTAACAVIAGGIGLAMPDMPGAGGLAAEIGGGWVVGVLLRKGCRPDVLMGAFAAALLTAHAPELTSLHSAAELAARSLVESGVSVAGATVTLLLLPRRGPVFQTHCRTRWDHAAFGLAFGPVALAGLYWGTTSTGGSGLTASLGLIGALLAALVGSLALDTRLRADAPPRRAILESLRRERSLAHAGKTLTHRLHRAMLERRQLRLERDAARNEAESLAARLRRSASIHAHTFARYQVLLEHSRGAVLFTDAQGTVLTANPAVLPLLGFRPSEVVGRSVRSLIPPHHILDHPLDHLCAERAEDLPDGIDAAILAKDSGTREVNLHVHRFAAGHTVNHLVQFDDAAGMKQAMATLERARTLERSAHQSRDLFIATMSHELRTPLHGLIATLDMMRVDESMSPQFEQRLSVARISARALLRIANDILDLTRFESGHIQLEQKPFSLERAIEEVVDESRARADSMGLSLEWHIRDVLPPAFIGDSTRLKQVLGNLVSNALHYTPSGGVRVEVTWDGRQFTIDVIDTGNGIPADKWQVIFDPFVQVPSTRNQRIGGTGLGLPISRRLIEAMGGSLVLARSDAAGSVFRICLAPPVSDEAPPDEQSQRIFSNPHARVLVVEDNPANRYVAEALLSSLECPTTLAESGDEALQVLAENEFDLVLMDCQLPGIDGYETTRRARRQLGRHIPIIAMTANAMMDDRQQCLDAGMDDFLPKPFGRQALHAMLCKWLDPEARARASGAGDETATRIAALPALDPSVFEELRESLQWRLQPLRNIRNTFVSSARNTVALLEGSRSADPHALRRQLHTLLGGAGMVGARQVEYLARRLQGCVEAGEYDAAAACVPLLGDALRHFESEFDHRLEISSDEKDWSGRTQGRKPSSRGLD